MTGEVGRPPPGPGSASGGPRGADTGGEQPPVLDQLFDGDSLYALRAAAAAYSSQAGLAEGRVGDLVLAVHELAANAVRHGAGRGRLRIFNTGTELRCEVADDGREDPAQWVIEPGHGLWVIRQVADQTHLHATPAGTVAVAAFALGPPGEPRPFRLTRQFRDGCTLMSVTGQLDLGSARRLTRAFVALPADGTASCLILDLSGLTGWDSSGLAALITAQRLVSDRPDTHMIVAGLPGRLRRRLHVAGFSSRFTWAESVDDALGMFGLPT
jgi:anti-anti-sigma factor